MRPLIENIVQQIFRASQGCGQDKAETTPPTIHQGSSRTRYICSAQWVTFFSCIPPPLFMICKRTAVLACPCFESKTIPPNRASAQFSGIKKRPAVKQVAFSFCMLCWNSVRNICLSMRAVIFLPAGCSPPDP